MEGQPRSPAAELYLFRAPAITSSLLCKLAVRFAADWIPLLVGMLLCARQPQLRYSWEASLLQALQLLRELVYHLLLLLHLFL